MAWNDVKHLYAGEKLFWAAVLRRAVFDYVLYKGVGARRRDWKRAYQYLFGGAQHDCGLNFTEVCGLFGWDPEYMRLLTAKLTRTDVRKLEFGKFRDEVMMEVITHIVENNLRWEFGYAVPFFPPHNYIPSYREAFTPKISKKRIRKVRWFTPKVRWSGILIDEQIIMAY